MQKIVHCYPILLDTHFNKLWPNFLQNMFDFVWYFLNCEIKRVQVIPTVAVEGVPTTDTHTEVRNTATVTSETAVTTSRGETSRCHLSRATQRRAVTSNTRTIH